MIKVTMMTAVVILDLLLIDSNPSARESSEKVGAKKVIRNQSQKALIQLQLLEIKSQIPQ